MRVYKTLQWIGGTLGDLFPQSERMLALSVFSFAGPCGAGFGYILGSGVTSLAKDAGAEDASAWKWLVFFVIPTAPCGL